jgi:hypothetical protein
MELGPNSRYYIPWNFSASTPRRKATSTRYTYQVQLQLWGKNLPYKLQLQIAEVGMRNFFLSPQSQLSSLKEAFPQSQFRNFLKNVALQPQLRNSAITIFYEVCNFKSAT